MAGALDRVTSAWRALRHRHTCSVCREPRLVRADHPSCLEFAVGLARREALGQPLAPAVEERLGGLLPRRCWSCRRAHSGHVWCPHCSAPVDPWSREAMTSPYWRAYWRSR